MCYARNEIQTRIIGCGSAFHVDRRPPFSVSIVRISHSRYKVKWDHAPSRNSSLHFKCSDFCQASQTLILSRSTAVVKYVAQVKVCPDAAWLISSKNLNGGSHDPVLLEASRPAVATPHNVSAALSTLSRMHLRVTLVRRFSFLPSFLPLLLVPRRSGGSADHGTRSANSFRFNSG